MPSSATKTSTFRLSEVARHVVVPSGIVSTGWPAVETKCRDLGVSFARQPWELAVGRIVLAKRADGKYAAGVGGTCLSIPRQVGKTFLVGCIVFALCLLFPGLTVIWTAHRLRTADETFAKMLGFSRRRKVAPHMLRPSLGSGEQEIRFRNGSRILFGARERGFGRGFDEVDVLIFDEAQILSENAIDDMVPATNQSRHPAGALLLFMGTPPKPSDPGEVFTRKRQGALAGGDGDTGWVEFGADPDAALTAHPSPMTAEDWRQFARANLSYPLFTPREAALRMRANLAPDSWRREALGIWDDDKTLTVAWACCADPDSLIVGRPVLAVSMTPDRSTVSLVAAGRRADGLLHVEVVLHGAAGAWFVPEVAEVAARQKCQVALVRSHPVGGLAADLESAKVRLRSLTATEYTAAVGAFYDDVTAGRLRYVAPQPELDAAVGRASRKKAGDAWRWDGDDISALVAATQAAHAVRTVPAGGKGRAIALS